MKDSVMGNPSLWVHDGDHLFDTRRYKNEVHCAKAQLSNDDKPIDDESIFHEEGLSVTNRVLANILSQFSITMAGVPTTRRQSVAHYISKVTLLSRCSK